MESISRGSGIEVTSGGAVSITGDGIKTYRTLTLWSAFSLWMVTVLQPTRGVRILSLVKEEYRLKGDKLKVCAQFARRLVDSGVYDEATMKARLAKIEKHYGTEITF